MFRFIGCLGLCLSVFLVSGCGSKGKGPTTTSVKGTVNLDGKPMSQGEVTFSIPGEPPQAIEVKDGKFSGNAHAGKNRVEIRQYKIGAAPTMGGVKVAEATKENILPARFNSDSQMTADVTAGGANDFKFDVASK